MNGDHELSRAIGRIEGKLDAIHEDVRDLWSHQSDTSKRVNTLEAVEDKRRGVLAVLAILAGAIGSFVTMMFK
jgi:hypothetical protein